MGTLETKGFPERHLRVLKVGVRQDRLSEIDIIEDGRPHVRARKIHPPEIG
jgi:hypothetical protein